MDSKYVVNLSAWIDAQVATGVYQAKGVQGDPLRFRKGSDGYHQILSGIGRLAAEGYHTSREDLPRSTSVVEVTVYKGDLYTEVGMWCKGEEKELYLLRLPAVPLFQQHVATAMKGQLPAFL